MASALSTIYYVILKQVEKHNYLHVDSVGSRCCFRPACGFTVGGKRGYFHCSYAQRSTAGVGDFMPLMRLLWIEDIVMDG